MKYKFIGTEQDLLDNGFEVAISFRRWFSKFIDKREVSITLNNPLYPNHNIFSFANDKFWDPTQLEVKQEHIQDLIDKGLVEVIK